MKLSIITATYNSATTVRDTMESVKNQDYPDIEHLIIDGMSNDETLSIVAEYPHVAKVICEKDSGIYDAMNKGIQYCSGDVIGILNSDDFYSHPRVLSQVMEAFRDLSVDTVYGDLQYVSADNVQVVTRTWISGQFRRKHFYYGWMPPHPAFFVRRKVYEQFGYFNISLRSAADYEFMLRVLLKHGATACYVREVLVKMRVGGISNVSLRNRLHANAEDRKAWKMNGLKPYFFTLYLKPARKIFQFIRK